MNPELESALQEFCCQCNVGTSNRGTACVLLHTTRYARDNGLPIDPNTLRSRNGGQVVRFSFRSVNRILSDYSPEWVDLGEAGRTNLANVWRAEQYVVLLNRLHQNGIADLAELERWWADRVMQLSEPQPLPLRYRKDQSLEAIFGDLVRRAQRIHRRYDGKRIERLLAQYFVKAVLQITAGRDTVGTGCLVTNLDSQPEAIGYQIGDVVVIVAIPFTRSAIQSRTNERTAVRQKVVITTDAEAAVARTYATRESTQGGTQVIAISQFLNSALLMVGGWSPDERLAFTRRLVDAYNREARFDGVAVDFLLAQT